MARHERDVDSLMTTDRLPSVAVIGAGMAGLCCAQRLGGAGLMVRVFDKARGVGGRVATRRNDGGAMFDHGAQYFTVEDALLRQHVSRWIAAGVVAPWQARIGGLNSGQWTSSSSETTRYVGVPTMTAVPKYLASDLDLVLQTHVTTIVQDAGSWLLRSETDEELGRFDVVILTAPAPQTANLVASYSGFAHETNRVTMAPCWAVMLTFETHLPLPFDAAFVEESPLSWIARNSSKPGRAASPDCWVLHASPEWSQRHIEDSAASVTNELLSAFWSETRAVPLPHSLAIAHRWRYASPRKPLAQRYIYDRKLRLGACGDWCRGPRVEGAFLSGLDMAEAVIQDSL